MVFRKNSSGFLRIRTPLLFYMQDFLQASRLDFACALFLILCDYCQFR
jgi:hypothetical protein